MEQEEITILRVRKNTRNRLRKLALAKRESYDEIINRLLGSQTKEGEEDNLEKEKQNLIKHGISKSLVNLVGTINKLSLEEEKETVRRAIIRKLIQ